MSRLCRTALMLSFALAPAFALARDDKPPIDEKTAAVMKKLGPVYKDAKSLHCEATIVTTVSDGDEKRDFNLKATIDLQRPNKFAMRISNTKDKAGGLDLVSNGEKVFTFVRRQKEYTEQKAPESMAPFAQRLQGLRPQNTGILFANVLTDEPVESLLEGISEGKHAGMEKVAGKECHHLKFKQEGMDWELWVAADGEAFVMKASSEFETPNGKMVVVETYSDWKRDAEPAKDAFTFTPPEGAKKVDRIGGGAAPKKAVKDDD